MFGLKIRLIRSGKDYKIRTCPSIETTLIGSFKQKMTCIYKLAQKNVSNGNSSYKISREQAKRTIFHASEQNDRANDSANDRALS